MRSLFGNATPGTVDQGDYQEYELGVKFFSDVAGFVTGIRFYKSVANTGTHTGNLWLGSNSSHLGTVTFSGETASGWQQMNFASPIAVSANTEYIASYHTTAGGYSIDQSYFSTQHDSVPLHAYQSDAGHGANGLYHSGAEATPNTGFNGSNFWVDLNFAPANSGFFAFM